MCYQANHDCAELVIWLLIDSIPLEQIPSSKSWFELFKLMHKIFIENADCEAFDSNDPDYVSLGSIKRKIQFITQQYHKLFHSFGRVL